MKKIFSFLFSLLFVILIFSCSNEHKNESNLNLKLSLSANAVSESDIQNISGIVYILDKDFSVIESKIIPSFTKEQKSEKLTFDSLEPGVSVQLCAFLKIENEETETTLNFGSSGDLVLHEGENIVKLALDSADVFVLENADSLKTLFEEIDIEQEVFFNTLDDAWETVEELALKKSVAVQLLTDSVVGKNLENGVRRNEVKIYLNGHTISREESFTNNSIFTSTSTISLYNGVLDGNDINATAPMLKNTSTLNLNGITIQNCKVVSEAGTDGAAIPSAINSTEGALYLTNSTIKNNYSNLTPIAIAEYAVIDSSEISENTSVISGFCNASQSSLVVVTGGTKITAKDGKSTSSDGEEYTYSSITNYGTVVIVGADVKGWVNNIGTFAILDSYTHSYTDASGKTVTDGEFSLEETQTNSITQKEGDTCAILHTGSGKNVIFGESAKINGAVGLISGCYFAITSTDFKKEPVVESVSIGISSDQTSSTFTAFQKLEIDPATGVSLESATAEIATKYFPLNEELEIKYEDDASNGSVIIVNK